MDRRVTQADDVVRSQRGGNVAFEVGRRWGFRVNTISAGPYASRAATAIGLIGRMISYTKQHSPLTREFEASDVGHAAAFLASPLAAGITGTVMYVDNGYHAMGMGVEVPTPRSQTE